MKSTNLVSVKDVELTHNVYEAEGKSYGHETRERNERQRKWKARGVEPPLTREEIRRQENEIYAAPADFKPNPFVLALGIFLLGVLFANIVSYA